MGKPEKKKFTSKVANHSIIDTEHADMVNALLFSHNLHNEFKAGERVGPTLKIWWTGVSKSLASTVNTDADWKEVRSSLQRKTEKARNVPNVFVEIQCDDLKGFRISPSVLVSKQVSPNTYLAVVILTAEPFVQSTVFTAKAKLHGDIILELKKLWPCSTHLGENGGQGYCYMPGNPDRDHVILTNYRLRVWAAACANLEATKHEPPATLAFDGPDNGSSKFRPRGKKGPGPSTLTPTPSTSSSADTLVGLVLGKFLADCDKSSPRYHPYQTPPRRPVPASPRRQLMSPAASPGTELETCLASFFLHEGIDFTSHAFTLSALDLTPDILSSADTPLLIDLLTTTIGKVLKLKKFGDSWNKRNSRKGAPALLSPLYEA
ncbi:hypothetical protein BKA70DRAFT_1126252 [Coprinopsis sp. MPI-PUGE-AT-0042]|nr:hypothetical protein BKA70DRAFT_1126252 [Coprinopsis sp. MPI-PUGE-AT-0042]